MPNQQDRNSFFPLILAEFRGTRKEDFGCYYTPCGSNSEESKKEKSISHNLYNTTKNAEEFIIYLEKSRKREESIDFHNTVPSKIRGRRRSRNNACCLRLCRWEWVHGFKFWGMKRNKSLEKWERRWIVEKHSIGF